MKDLTRSLLSFVLVYGTKDRERFDRHALSLIERFGLEEKDQRELIDFAYEFFHELGQRFNQIDIISRGVNNGVGDLEKKLEAITDKLSAMESRMQSNSDGHRDEAKKQ